jgi:hypothetical protein
MHPYRTRIKARKANKRKADWNELWKRLRATYEYAGKDRQVAVLDNYSRNKETICRKLGVVCHADVRRIYTEIKSTT